jgi:regulator of sigma D
LYSLYLPEQLTNTNGGTTMTLTIKEFIIANAATQRRVINNIIRDDSKHLAEDRRKLSKSDRINLYTLYSIEGKTSQDVAETADQMITDHINNGSFEATSDTDSNETTTEKNDMTDAERKLKQLQDILGTQNEAPLNTEAIKAICQEMIDKITAPRKVTVYNEQEKTFKDMGVQHKTFPDLLTACSARLAGNERLNIWLNGGAGSGKTTAAKKVAEALGLSFHFVGAIDNEYKLNGFTDAQGRVVSTEFRKAWENGGVFLFDEVDGSNPNAVLSFNGALANGVCPFPDKAVKRHTDCVIIAAGNSVTGATAEFNGRFKPDAAFFDRFALIDWSVDEALELATCSNPDWCKYVQSVRKRATDRKYKNFTITPRASYQGAALLDAGLPRETVVKMVLKKQLTDQQWQEVA